MRIHQCPLSAPSSHSGLGHHPIVSSTLLSTTNYDFVDKDLADFFREKDRAAMATGEPSLNEEEVIYADDGHREHLETIRKSMLAADGKLFGVLGVSRDITERKQAEEVSKYNPQATRHTSSVCHRLCG